MENYIKEIIIGLFAGTNILSLVFFRSTKRKAQAEADSVTLANKQKALDIRQDAMKGIQQQCDDMMARMLNMQTDLQKALMDVAQLKASCVAKDSTIKRLTEERDFYKAKCERAESDLSRLKKIEHEL